MSFLELPQYTVQYLLVNKGRFGIMSIGLHARTLDDVKQLCKPNSELQYYVLSTSPPPAVSISVNLEFGSDAEISSCSNLNVYTR